MNWTGKFIRESYNKNGQREVTFTCNSLDDFQEDKMYAIDIKERKPKRSLQANAYFWSLVNQIALKENGNLKDVNELYVMLLKMSGAKYETISGSLQAIKALEGVKGIRGVDVLKTDGKRAVANIYVGSSQFDSSEMAQLIDTTLNYASEVGIETSYWTELLK